MSIKIGIIGTGYVGLVSGTCLAEIGHEVICFDKDVNKIASLNNGNIPIYEPGLETLVKNNVKNGRLKFAPSIENNLTGVDVIFICVGTPMNAKTGNADLSYVEQAAREIAENCETNAVIVLKSTVPVGTNRKILKILTRYSKINAKLTICSNPEFLREGVAVSDFLNPDRIVIGSEDVKTKRLMRRVYAPLLTREVSFVSTTLETAELIKYASNSFLAVKLSFINELADLSETIGADIDEVAHGMGLDKRIGKSFLKAGPGWGGSCFPKDTKALIYAAKQSGVTLSVVDSAVKANAVRKKNMAAKIIAHFGGDIRGKKIGVLGLTFKGQTDDMRDSPALDILPALIQAGAKVTAFDPAEPHDAKAMIEGLRIAPSALDAARDSEALVVLTEWKEFTALDLGALSTVMKDANLFDLRNLYTISDAYEAGFENYYPLGKTGYDKKWFDAADAKQVYAAK